MTEDIFNPDQGSVDYLAELTGPGKKFDKTKYQDDTQLIQAISKGKYESDLYVQHILNELKELKDDNKQLREYNDTRANLEEIVDQLETRKLTSSDNTHQAKEVTNQPVIDPNKIKEMVASTVKELSDAEQQNRNLETVRNKLKEQFGDNYQAALSKHVDELGLDQEFVRDLARRSPIALFRTLGLDAPRPKETFQAPPVSQQRGFSPAVQKKTWSYYQALKQSNPKVYWEPRIQNEMYKSRIELGDAFIDGDFNTLTRR